MTGSPLLALTTVLLLCVMASGCVVLQQRRQVYRPRIYVPEERAAQPPSALWVTARTARGTTSGLYVPPPGGGVPRRVWFVFNGSGGITADWYPFVRQCPDAGTAFLLWDYPGYGASSGYPSQRSIQKAAEELHAALAEHLQLRVEDLHARTAVLGRSLGCATALEYARQRPAARVVLLSPFTSLSAMARLRVGRFLALFLLEDYDNVATLRALARRPEAPPVLILHGDADAMVPFRMGEALAAAAPDVATLIRLPGRDHETVYTGSYPDIYRAMGIEAPQPAP